MFENVIRHGDESGFRARRFDLDLVVEVLSCETKTSPKAHQLSLPES